MAACYSSSASAPLHALANQLLGESTAAAKTSLFRNSNHPSHQQQQQQQQQQHHPQQHQSTRLFPGQHHPNHLPRQTQHHEKQADLFDQAWAASVATPLTGEHWSPQFMQPRPLFQRHLPDLDLISSWEHAVQETTPFRPQQHLPLENQHRAAPTTVGGMAMSAGPEEYSLTEYEAFQYLPSQAAVAQSVAGNDSAWAQEMTRGQQEEDDEDDEDEFREEWSNDHFTQAYINSHQQQFRKIEEQEDLKEARLAEERERQRVVSGGPPRSAWMMAGSTVSAPNTSTASSIMPVASGSKRLRVPGLQEPSSADVQEQISVDEFLQFHHAESLNGPSSMQPMLESQHQQQLKPIKAEDRFLSLVSDLRLAEQIYYPGASSATLIEQEPTSSEQPHSRITKLPSAGGGAWAQEFTDGHRYQQTRQQQRHLGAEWNWEKLFGKDPRKALQLATEASKASAAMAGGPASEMTEHERLKTVALARLQALFGHLSLASPHTAPCPP